MRVMPTSNALQFIGALSFEALSGQKCLSDELCVQDGKIAHIEEAEHADALIFAPASANMIAKLAHGMADSLPLQTYLSFRGPVVVAPAMETHMWEHAATQDNVGKLRDRGSVLVGPNAGALASGREGLGRMAEPSEILEAICAALSPKDFAGKRVLLTAGPTIEDIDPVRYIANRSSGKMGVALARALAQRGAQVTLVHGPMSAEVPRLPNIVVEPVRSAAQMYGRVMEHVDRVDIAIMCAAVADFTPSAVSQTKIKKTDGVPQLVLEPTIDILKAVGMRDKRPFLVGFAAETSHMIEEAHRKCAEKNCDLVCANMASAMDADVNEIAIVDQNHNVMQLPRGTKDDVAHGILDAVLKQGS